MKTDVNNLFFLEIPRNWLPVKLSQTFHSIALLSLYSQASLIGFPAPHRTETQNTWVAFSNPASSSIRENMSIRISRDGCKTWSKPWTIYPYRAAYSDLTYFETTDPVTGLKQQNFAILFEGGKHFSFKKIMFKMFNLDAVLTGIQRTYRRLPQTNEASETDYY